MALSSFSSTGIFRSFICRAAAATASSSFAIFISPLPGIEKSITNPWAQLRDPTIDMMSYRLFCVR